MKPRELSAATIPQLADGNAGDIINEGLAWLADDVRDRPEEVKARELTIKLKLQPAPGERVAIVVEVAGKCPGKKTSVHNGELRRLDGKTVIAFVPDSLGDSQQQTLTPEE